MKKRIALLTSGGDAPGMNAAIRVVARSGTLVGFTIFGVRSGFSDLIQGDFIPLDSRSEANIIQCGGTILKTSRCEEFKASEGLQKAKDQLGGQKIDVLIIIGGDGSFLGAMELSEIWNRQIIGVPGTIDNDLYGTDETIGFDKAINTALYAADKIRDTVDAHGRFFLIEVIGRLSDYIALHAGLAGGAEEVFIPEQTIDIDHLCTKLCEYRKQGKADCINKSNVYTPLEESIKNKKNIDQYEYELLHKLS